jgi:hypothetical protein
VVECGSDDATVAMWSCDFAPDDSDLRALSFPGGSVDECYTLPEVESARRRLAIHCTAIDFCVHSASAAVLSLLLLVCDGNVDGILTVHHSGCRHPRSLREMYWGLCYAFLVDVKGVCP